MRAPGHLIVTAPLLLLFSRMAISGEPWGPGDLQAFAGLTANQWQAVKRDGPQARIVDTKEKREVAVVGIAHLRSTAACFTTMLRDIEDFKQSPAVLRIRKFDKPVEPQDLEGLRLEEADVNGLANCRVGACNVKLPAAAIERFGRDVDRSRPDYATTSQEILSRRIAGVSESLFRSWRLGTYRVPGQAPVSPPRR